MNIVERVLYSARIAAKTYWDEHFGVVTIVDKDGVPFGTSGSPIAVSMSSDIEIGAVELKDGATDNRAIINDANTARNATDHVLLVQTLDALGNVVGASAGMPFISTHYAPNDFTATRTNDTTVAITVGPVVMTTTNTLVAYITKKSATNVVTTYINGTGGVSLYISANDTLTLIGGTVGATDTIQSVGVRIFDKENTITTNSKRAEIINGLNTFRTGPQTIGAQKTFTTAYVDWGPEIAVTNYNKLMLFIDKTFDGADSGLKLQILGKHTGAAADEYVLETDIALGDATGYIAISRPALLNNCVEYIQLQIKADGDASPLSTVNAGSKYELAW
jgi:hypothetical protein